MSVADALMLMLVFGGFILSLIALIITIMLIIVDNQKRPSLIFWRR
ncbi:putative holin-like toxin [Lacticaseibacillus rhamnosus]